MFVVIFASNIAGWFIMFPIDYEELGESTIAACFSLANVYFWFKSGYFATASELKPLLHTWSLSIEEQFYLFLPLLLVAKFTAKHQLKIIGSITVVSLIICIYGTKISPSATFYLLPTRVWELALGSLLSVLILRINQTESSISETLRNILGSIGLLLIFTSLLFNNFLRL